MTYDLKGETIELSSVIEVRDGTHDSPKPKENGFPLVTSKHLLPFGVDLTSCNLISQADYNKINGNPWIRGRHLPAAIGTLV